MRPTGGRASPAVFEVVDGRNVFVGLVAPKAKMAYYAKPGDRLFMVQSENTNLMVAHLAPGKVYHALIEPHMGWTRPRYSLDPVAGSKVNTSDFADWYADTRWVENSPIGLAWARRKAFNVHQKMTKYLPEWEERTDKPVLNLEDGQPGLYRGASAN